MRQLSCESFEGGIDTRCLEPNVAGVQELFLATFDDITVTVTGGTVTAITGASGATADIYYSWQFRKNSASADTSYTFQDNGNATFTQTLTVTIPKQEKVKRDVMMSLSKAQTSMIVKDKNGLYWLYGKNFGCYLQTLNAPTGLNSQTDTNGYTVTIQADEQELPLPVSDSLFPGIVI